MAKYKLFREKNPDFKSRVEAILNGILSPDPKGIALQAMDPRKAYTKTELYENVLEFCGLNEKEFPLTDSMWVYFNGNPRQRRKGSLKEIGAVVELKVKPKRTRYAKTYATAYQKTDAGKDFGDPAVALGTYLVNEFKNLKYHSLQRVLSYPQRGRDRKYRRGYSIYKVAELLAKNPDSEFRWKDIVEELEGELSSIAISSALNSLGEVGVIDYQSPCKDVEGKKAKGWAVYRVKEKIDYEKALEEVKKGYPKFHNLGYLKKIVEYINKNPDEEFEHHKISEKLGIHPKQAALILSQLKKLGYLTSEFSGNIHSKAKANEFTLKLWEELLEPIGKAVEKLDPYVEEFREKLEFYEEKPEIWKDHIRNQLKAYEMERKNVGRKGGKEIRKAILEVLSSFGKPMKRSHIAEEVDKRISRKGISRSGIRNQLKNLEKEGKIKKVRKGYYALKEHSPRIL